MTRKTFLTINGLSLCGDERDIMVPKKYYWDVLTWCQDQGIVAENAFAHDQATYESRASAMLFDVNLWRIRNERHRVMFVLRWA